MIPKTFKISQQCSRTGKVLESKELSLEELNKAAEAGQTDEGEPVSPVVERVLDEDHGLPLFEMISRLPDPETGEVKETTLTYNILSEPSRKACWKAFQQAKPPKKRTGGGRPKGSKNKAKGEGEGENAAANGENAAAATPA